MSALENRNAGDLTETAEKHIVAVTERAEVSASAIFVVNRSARLSADVAVAQAFEEDRPACAEIYASAALRDILTIRENLIAVERKMERLVRAVRHVAPQAEVKAA